MHITISTIHLCDAWQNCTVIKLSARNCNRKSHVMCLAALQWNSAKRFIYTSATDTTVRETGKSYCRK
jgi:hypothetical protein